MITAIKALGKGWDRFWFSFSDEYHYGVLRMLFLGRLIFFELPETLSGSWPQRAREAPLELFDPSLAARWLSPPPEWVVAHSDQIQTLLLILAVAATVGIFTRVSIVGYSFLFLVKQGFINSFGLYHHQTPLVAVVLIVLAAAPGSTTLSVDAALRELYSKLRGRTPTCERLLFGGRVPVWPARLILVFLALFYCTSGISKIRHGGWRWLDGTTLAFSLSEHRAAGGFTVRPGTGEQEKWRDGFGLESFVYDYGSNSNLAHKLSGSRLFTQTASGMTVLFELGCPLLLLSRKICYVYFAALVVFSFSLGAAMNLNFLRMYWPVCALVINWNVVVGRSVKR